MPTTRSPRHGSMQFWPRKRATRAYARVRSWAKSDKAAPLGFAGYKVGMTHVMINDTAKNSRTRGMEVSIPVTIIECPPLKIASVRFYKKDAYGMKVVDEIFAKVDKELGRKIPLQKKEKKLDDIKPADYADIRINVYTQPKLTSIGKKKPELFEVAIGGSNEDKFSYAKENLGKEVMVGAVFEPGQQIDIHSVTRGRGFQGAVKRFGIGLTSHKSEKDRRTPGSLGGWKGQGHFMYRIAHAGQMGYHTRTEFNKWILKISDQPEDVNPKGGFIRYGNVKNPCMIVKGSIGGASKRLIRMNTATKPNKSIPKDQPDITHISIDSKQGV